MSRAGEGDYVVELRVAGVAVVSVRASSDDEARTLAIKRVRPVDVTELDDATFSRGVRFERGGPRAVDTPTRRPPVTPSAGSA